MLLYYWSLCCDLIAWKLFRGCRWSEVEHKRKEGSWEWKSLVPRNQINQGIFLYCACVQLLVVSIIIASPSTCHINSDSFTWKLVLVTQTMLNLTASTSHNLSSPYLPLARPIVLAHQKLRLPPSAHRVMITFDFIVNIFLVRIRFYRGMEIGNFIPPIAYTRRNKKLTQRQFHSFHDDSIRLLNWSRLRGEYLLYVRKETKEKYYERHKGI